MLTDIQLAEIRADAMQDGCVGCLHLLDDVRELQQENERLRKALATKHSMAAGIFDHERRLAVLEQTEPRLAGKAETDERLTRLEAARAAIEARLEEIAPTLTAGAGALQPDMCPCGSTPVVLHAGQGKWVVQCDACGKKTWTRGEGAAGRHDAILAWNMWSKKTPPAPTTAPKAEATAPKRSACTRSYMCGLHAWNKCDFRQKTEDYKLCESRTEDGACTNGAAIAQAALEKEAK